MAVSRDIPSGKVYRQMFDAQVQLSRSLHDTRRKRVTNEGFLPSGHPLGEEMAVRDQLFSGITLCQKSDKTFDEEEVCGLPDDVVAVQSGSDIVQRLTEMKQRKHEEMMAQLHSDLSVISVDYETRYSQTCEQMLHQLSVYDDNMERQMKRIENISDLEKFTLQELHEFWEIMKEESVMRRKRINDLNKTLTKHEFDRKDMIASLLRKYTGNLEKIGYVLPLEIHRLIHEEAMMINQALLANRRALGKLYVNLMDKDLQKERSHRLRWEDKLQDWKRIKILGVVKKFKKFMGSSSIQRPKDLKAILDTMDAAQHNLQEQRITILQSVTTMIPPTCSMSQVTEWYKSLSCINEKIDCLHINSMRKLHSAHENKWQECLHEVEQFKKELSIYGISSEEVQNIVDAEFLTLIDKCQRQDEKHVASMEATFASLAKTGATLSMSLFKFMRGISDLCEVRRAGLLRREHQLQLQLDEVRYRQQQETQKEEAHLDVMLDKLRQESTEETLKTTLETTLDLLDEIKDVYLHFYKEEGDVVDGYPAMVLEEHQSYSSAVRHFFNVKEINSQGFEEKNPAHSTFDKHDTEVNADSHLEFFDSQSSETFVTSKGNVYKALRFVSHLDTKLEPIPPELESVRFPRSLLVDLQKDVRLLIFNHLEEEGQSMLTDVMNTVAAKKEALKSEQDLRMHLHQPRATRIQMDIHNVRAAELLLHRECVERHCEGVLQALSNCQTNFKDIQSRQHKLTEDFKSQIYSMQDLFTRATKSDALVRLCGSLQSNLERHMNVIQESQRHFRQTLEAKLDGLRESNVQLMKSFKLFSEGGNFTPKEIKMLHKQIEKMAKQIDTTDEALMLNMEGTESRCLEQAKDVINKFEEKFHFLAVDLKFLEKIQGLLTNTQVQIKTEAAKSNMQQKKIKSLLTELTTMVDDRCAEKTLMTENILTFTWSILEELRSRCHYLECFLDPSMAVPVPDCPLRGAYAVSARQYRKQNKPSSPETNDLLQPSRIGVPFIGDPIVGVIKGLQRLCKPKITEETPSELPEKGSPAVTATLSSLIGQRTRKSASVESLSVKRSSKPTRFDKRFQVFGPKPEESATTFKAVIGSILWKANDTLLQVAEDFYKKEHRPITRHKILQETVEQCAEDINRRLLGYQRQARDYHSSSLQEFRQQLTSCEEHLAKMLGLLISQLGEQHLRNLIQDTGNIRQQLTITLQESECKKSKHSSELSVRLSHPACQEQLEALKIAEDERQKELANVITSAHQELQACVIKHGEEFVRAITALTNRLLFQMDKLLTVNEVQVAHTETKTENVPTLIYQKQAGTVTENQSGHSIQRSSRAWPGLSYLGWSVDEPLEQPRKMMASITTVKTTLVHLRVVEARDSMYQRYELQYKEELDRALRDSQIQGRASQSWVEHWRDLLNTLAQLKSE
ncbi:hypothetical protein UPYG_G00188780 [Umbra pygmaea]|uniref:Coiled-coil domain-containing protein 180 n=1 Tax=Umbra pygmaea TaxID=75934 RepID=A0ABD0XHG9_UMBPY